MRRLRKPLTLAERLGTPHSRRPFHARAFDYRVISGDWKDPPEDVSHQFANAVKAIRQIRYVHPSKHAEGYNGYIVLVANEKIDDKRAEKLVEEVLGIDEDF